MIPRNPFGKRQGLAQIPGRGHFAFRGVAGCDMLSLEARNTHSAALVCQDRYPSPTSRLDPARVEPLFSTHAPVIYWEPQRWGRRFPSIRGRTASSAAPSARGQSKENTKCGSKDFPETRFGPGWHWCWSGRWPAASRTTPSVVSPVRSSAVRLRARPATTSRPAPLSAARPACSAARPARRPARTTDLHRAASAAAARMTYDPAIAAPCRGGFSFAADGAGTGLAAITEGRRCSTRS